MRNLLTFIKKRPLVTMLFVALFGAALVGAIVPSVDNTALAASRDCSSNAIMHCGSHTAAEFQQKYRENKPGDLKEIYAHYGVNPSELSGAKNGYVTKSGNVTVNGKVVATNAYTVGRTTMPQSHTIKINGKTYYERNNTSNFGNDLEALVVLDQFGRFKYAVIKNCGNPVVAEPKQPKPSVVCNSLTAVVTNRKTVTLKATATAANGGKVNQYNFVVSDKYGNTPFTKTTTSSTVTATIEKPGTYTVKVILLTNLGNIESKTCEKSFTIEKEKTPGVSIEKTVNGKEQDVVGLKVAFNYNLTVKNTGDVDLVNVKVTDNAPEGVEFISATSNGNLDGNKKWYATIPSLKKGESRKFTIVARATKTSETPIVNTACVDAKEVPGDNDDCDDAKITVPPVKVINKIDVCDLETKQTITIDETAFDSTKHSKNLDDCKEVPPVTELPQTGPMDALLSIVGLGALVASSAYFVLSRIRA